MKTSELTGAALDWAVAKCEGAYAPSIDTDIDGTKRINYGGMYPEWSTDWAQGGPIIERERIGVLPITVTVGDEKGKREWFASYEHAAPSESAYLSGDTALVAAMRCYVASKLGDTVDVPEELTK